MCTCTPHLSRKLHGVGCGVSSWYSSRVLKVVLVFLGKHRSVIPLRTIHIVKEYQ